jgi:hypothetical protein
MGSIPFSNVELFQQTLLLLKKSESGTVQGRSYTGHTQCFVFATSPLTPLFRVHQNDYHLTPETITNN